MRERYVPWRTDGTRSHLHNAVITTRPRPVLQSQNHTQLYCLAIGEVSTPSHVSAHITGRGIPGTPGSSYLGTCRAHHRMVVMVAMRWAWRTHLTGRDSRSALISRDSSIDDQVTSIMRPCPVVGGAEGHAKRPTAHVHNRHLGADGWTTGAARRHPCHGRGACGLGRMESISASFRCGCGWYR